MQRVVIWAPDLEGNCCWWLCSGGQSQALSSLKQRAAVFPRTHLKGIIIYILDVHFKNKETKPRDVFMQTCCSVCAFLVRCRLSKKQMMALIKRDVWNVFAYGECMAESTALLMRGR